MACVKLLFGFSLLTFDWSKSQKKRFWLMTFQPAENLSFISQNETFFISF